MGELGGVDPDLPVALEPFPHELRGVVPRAEDLDRQFALLCGLLLQRGRRDLAGAVRREPGATSLEETVREAGRVEERHVDVRVGRVEEDDEVDTVIEMAENLLHALAHEAPRSYSDAVVKGWSGVRT